MTHKKLLSTSFHSTLFWGMALKMHHSINRLIISTLDDALLLLNTEPTKPDNDAFYNSRVAQGLAQYLNLILKYQDMGSRDVDQKKEFLKEAFKESMSQFEELAELEKKLQTTLQSPTLENSTQYLVCLTKGVAALMSVAKALKFTMNLKIPFETAKTNAQKSRHDLVAKIRDDAARGGQNDIHLTLEMMAQSATTDIRAVMQTKMLKNAFKKQSVTQDAFSGTPELAARPLLNALLSGMKTLKSASGKAESVNPSPFTPAAGLPRPPMSGLFTGGTTGLKSTLRPTTVKKSKKSNSTLLNEINRLVDESLAKKGPKKQSGTAKEKKKVELMEIPTLTHAQSIHFSGLEKYLEYYSCLKQIQRFLVTHKELPSSEKEKQYVDIIRTSMSAPFREFAETNCARKLKGRGAVNSIKTEIQDVAKKLDNAISSHEVSSNIDAFYKLVWATSISDDGNLMKGLFYYLADKSKSIKPFISVLFRGNQLNFFQKEMTLLILKDIVPKLQEVFTSEALKKFLEDLIPEVLKLEDPENQDAWSQTLNQQLLGAFFDREGDRLIPKFPMKVYAKLDQNTVPEITSQPSLIEHCFANSEFDQAATLTAYYLVTDSNVFENRFQTLLGLMTRELSHGSESALRPHIPKLVEKICSQIATFLVDAGFHNNPEKAQGVLSKFTELIELVALEPLSITPDFPSPVQNVLWRRFIADFQSQNPRVLRAFQERFNTFNITTADWERSDFTTRVGWVNDVDKILSPLFQMLNIIKYPDVDVSESVQGVLRLENDDEWSRITSYVADINPILSFFESFMNRIEDATENQTKFKLVAMVFMKQLMPVLAEIKSYINESPNPQESLTARLTQLEELFTGYGQDIIDFSDKLRATKPSQYKENKALKDKLVTMGFNPSIVIGDFLPYKEQEQMDKYVSTVEKMNSVYKKINTMFDIMPLVIASKFVRGFTKEEKETLSEEEKEKKVPKLEALLKEDFTRFFDQNKELICQAVVSLLCLKSIEKSAFANEAIEDKFVDFAMKKINEEGLLKEFTDPYGFEVLTTYLKGTEYEDFGKTRGPDAGLSLSPVRGSLLSPERADKESKSLTQLIEDLNSIEEAPKALAYDERLEAFIEEDKAQELIDRFKLSSMEESDAVLDSIMEELPNCLAFSIEVLSRSIILKKNSSNEMDVDFDKFAKHYFAKLPLSQDSLLVKCAADENYESVMDLLGLIILYKVGKKLPSFFMVLKGYLNDGVSSHSVLPKAQLGLQVAKSFVKAMFKGMWDEKFYIEFIEKDRELLEENEMKRQNNKNAKLQPVEIVKYIVEILKNLGMYTVNDFSREVARELSKVLLGSHRFDRYLETMGTNRNQILHYTKLEN